MKQKLTKSARLAFIASLCAGMSSALQPSRHDLREESELMTHNQDMGLLPIDDDLPELAPSLTFDGIKPENDDSILTAKERRHLAKERLNYLVKIDLSRPRNPFALAIV